MTIDEAAGRQMRILVINWQDRENPQAGGAEIHLHEIFGGLAERGHDVRAVVGGWPGCAPRTTLDGIQVTRIGRRYTFPLHVGSAVRRELRRRPADVVVEDINKIPLYAPGWVRAPVVALVPHLFGATAFAEVAWPLAAAVWASERWIPRGYRTTFFQAISEGTATDLVRRGVDRDRITVIRPGIDHSAYVPSPTGEREPWPTLLYVGRLKKYKGIDVVLRATALLVARDCPVRLEIAGQGSDRERLESIVDTLGLRNAVTFLGWISEADKIGRLQKAWVAVYPSPKEGWGLVNVEAAACGTPVVASDSPGLNESVRDGVSGFLVAHQDAGAWADALEPMLRDPEASRRLRNGAVDYAARFSWDRAAGETESHLREVLARPSGAHGMNVLTGEGKNADHLHVP